MQAEERFWSRVTKGPDCWAWTGAVNADGYGQFSHEGRRWRAHRFSWELGHGPIPDGFHVLHSCDNPPCTNPAHLRLGTDADNAADRVARGRQHDARGEKQSNAKLTDNQVRAIRTLYRNGTHTQRQLARKFEVDPSTISLIVSRKRWDHL